MSSTTLDDDRDLVVAHLWYRGADFAVLTKEQQEHARCYGDGFGDLTGLHNATDVALAGMSLRRRDVVAMLWDWSHIRDSTPGAIRRIAAYIREVTA